MSEECRRSPGTGGRMGDTGIYVSRGGPVLIGKVVWIPGGGKTRTKTKTKGVD